jgi:hypothetical protein
MGKKIEPLCQYTRHEIRAEYADMKGENDCPLCMKIQEDYRCLIASHPSSQGLFFSPSVISFLLAFS